MRYSPAHGHPTPPQPALPRRRSMGACRQCRPAAGGDDSGQRLPLRHRLGQSLRTADADDPAGLGGRPDLDSIAWPHGRGALVLCARQRGFGLALVDPYMLEALCIAYPFYTGGLQRNEAAFWGTVVTLIAAVAVMFTLRRGDARAPWLLVPTAIWGGYVLSVMIAYPPA